jgi:hypothetical protein
VRKYVSLTFVLAVLSLLSGYLLSKVSLTGRAGISLFYKEYRFLKVWWQGALVVFGTLLLLLLLQASISSKLTRTKANLFHGFMILLALLGLYFTYQDFRHTIAHRLLGERFHLGAYLFWISWIISSAVQLFYNVKVSREV